MANWLAPTIGFVLIVGAQGVCAKLALEHVTWQQLLLWTTLPYVVLSCALFAGGTPLRTPTGPVGALVGAAVLTPVAGLMLFYVALDLGPSSRVVPVSSVYPLVTVLLAYLFLSEDVGVTTLVGTALIAVGVALVAS
jgi:bacterial/archaeal transporter family protein